MRTAQPLFLKIATAVQEQILIGALLEGQQVPSTNELAMFYKINQATAAKGINLLVDQGVLHKRRGVGMFISAGARQILLDQRAQSFTDEYVKPLVSEARALNIDLSRLLELVAREYPKEINVPEVVS